MTDGNVGMRQVAGLIKTAQLIPVIGAGMSRRSGLPVVSSIVEVLFDHLLQGDAMAADHRKALLQAALPFEVVIDQLVKHFDIASLFLHGRPNANHRLFAEMAMRSWLPVIATTNFDVLIEEALVAAGLRPAIDFEVMSSEQEFAALQAHPARNLRCRVLKLHGCASKPRTVRTTVRAIAARQLAAVRVQAIQHVFAAGSHSAVLTLGYSASDHFDINPQLAAVRRPEKSIYAIFHRPSPVLPSKHPFHRFPGARVEADTEAWLGELATELGLDAPTWHTETVNWQDALKRLLCTLTSGMAHLVAAGLLFAGRSPTHALQRFGRALEAAREEKDVRCQVQALGGHAMCFRTLERPAEALAADRAAMSIGMDLDDDLVGGLYRSLGNSHACLQEYDQAERCYEQAQTVNRRSGNAHEEQHAWTSIGRCASARGDLAKAGRAYQEALNLSEQNGDLHGAVLLKLNLVSVEARQTGGPPNAQESERILGEARTLSDPQLESHALHHLGLVAAHRGETGNAIAMLTAALEINRRIEHLSGIRIIEHNLALLRKGQS